MTYAQPYPFPVGRPAPPPVPFRRTRLAFGLTATGSAAVAGLAVLVGNSFPGGHFTLALLGVGVGLVAGVAWLVAVILALVARRFSVNVLVPPLLVGVALGLVTADSPLQARFALARPAFEGAIADRGAAGPGAVCPSWVGTYRISRCATSGSITLFYDRDGGFLDSVGFAYAPDGVPAPTGGDGSVAYAPMAGPWYTFQQSW